MKLLLLSLITSSIVLASNVNLKTSYVQWTGSKITGTEHTGKALFKEATVVTKNNKITSGNFVVDMESFSVEDLKGGTAKKFIGHMKSADFFDTSKFPTATLKITSVKGNTVTANMTIKSKSQPVTFKYKMDAKTIMGSFEIDRTKFNMTYGSGNFFKNLGDKVISDKVKLSFKILVK